MRKDVQDELVVEEEEVKIEDEMPEEEDFETLQGEVGTDGNLLQAITIEEDDPPPIQSNLPKHSMTTVLNSKNKKSQYQEMDEIIKSMFMWNLGRGNMAVNLDLTQGIGLAILSQVIGIKQIEEEI